MRSLWLLLVAGCNQVFGIEPTQLQDAAQVVVDATPPIRLVQAVAMEEKDTNKNVLALRRPVAVGDAVVIGIYTESALVTSVTGTLGMTYEVLVGPIKDPSPANLYIYGALVTTAGMETITVNVDNNKSPSIEVYLHELSNVTAFDGGTGSGGSSQNPDETTSGAFQTHHDNELIFGFGVADTVAAGTNFLTFSTYDNNLTEGLPVDAAGSYAAIATSTSSWTMLAAGIVGL